MNVYKTYTYTCTYALISPALHFRYNMQPKNLTTIESGEIQSQWKHMFASVGVVMTIGGLIYCLVGRTLNLFFTSPLDSRLK